MTITASSTTATATATCPLHHVLDHHNYRPPQPSTSTCTNTPPHAPCSARPVLACPVYVHDTPPHVQHAQSIVAHTHILHRLAPCTSDLELGATLTLMMNFDIFSLTSSFSPWSMICQQTESPRVVRVAILEPADPPNSDLSADSSASLISLYYDSAAPTAHPRDTIARL